ncbi:MAG: site-2 protease family protein [Nitrospinaceae bacterium]|jgi:membrane-associated protease RseP (regulator of RpoE activity)|nr:site-2 protease family protein [Nitrospina sp.]MBT5376627.1 site-2 protease family protein [Nitrospinaceae bacterium]MBT5867344.1 site-2 protease family protein [Nitrospinaceae bacterium]MBT6347400.1 site-2 protease family protein [Nitrospina sp.]
MKPSPHEPSVILSEAELEHKNWWLFSILLVATLVTTYLSGGLLFSVSLILILGAHEFGHYWASRKNGVRSTLPYFIPAPPIFIAGTFGAFIQIKQTIPNRRVLLEIGAFGPIAGFIVAVPTLMYGLSLSTTSSVLGLEGISFGSSFILNLCSEWILGVNPQSPNVNIHLHPIAFAGWIGLFVTALNLIPMGQLDGGHIIFALFPKQHVLLGRIFFLALFPLGYFWHGWYFWAVMVILMGFKTAPLVDDTIELSPKHKVLGLISIAIFMVTFIPVPFSVI